MKLCSRLSTHARTVGAMVLCTAVLAACGGENLFSLAATGSEGGATVDITTPAANFTLAVGDSIQIIADAASPDGLATAEYRGSYTEDGVDAFVGKTEALGGTLAVTLTNLLGPAPGQVAGSVYIGVEVADQGGSTAKDSVKVTIN